MSTRAGAARSPRWEPAELELLITRFPIEAVPELSRALGRAPGAVRTKASQLGLRRRTTAPTPVDRQLIRREYGSLACAEIARRLGPGWTAGRVTDCARRMGLRQRRAWTSAEDELLRREYPRRGTAWCAEQLQVTRGSVRGRVEQLGIPHGRFWSTDDEAQIRSRYPREPTAAIAQELGRTSTQIHHKAKALGIVKTVWTPGEDARLEAVYTAGVPVNVIARELGRRVVQVRRRAGKLGLRRRSPFSPAAAELLLELRDERGAVEFFASQFGLTPQVVRRELQRMTPTPGDGESG